MADAEQASDKASKSIQQSLKNIGQSWSNMGKQMSMKLTAPIVGVGVAAFKMSGDFDEAFRKTNVMLKATTEEAANYKKRILEISSATGKSAKDVADAFYQIVSAGYRGTDSLDILEVATKGAVGGGAELISTVAALTKGMNIFGLEGVSGATRAMDVFFGIVDTGLLTFEQMANAFPNAASSAAALGIPIEEVGAALGTLTKVTGSTDDAATALNNTFMQLIKPSDKMKDLYAEWGVKTGPEAIKKFGGLSGVLKKVAEATGGEVDQLAELFPSIRALKAVLPLVTTNAYDYASATDTVTNSQGRTNEAFDEMSQGAGFALKQSLAKIANASIILGDVLEKYVSPALSKVSEWIKKVAEWFKALDPHTQKTILTFIGIVAAVGPILIILGQLAMALSFLISPIGLVMVAILALIAVGVLLWRNWDWVKEKTTAIWNSIADFFKGIWDKIVGFFKENWALILAILFPPIGLPLLIAENWGKITDIVKTIWEAVTKEIRTAWDNIVSHILSGVEWLIEQVNSVISLINRIPGINIGNLPSSISSVILGKSTATATPSWASAYAAGKAGFEAATGETWQHGGIITQPTFGLAGEAGPEAIIPLNEIGGLGGITVNFTQPVFFDREDTMNRFVDMIRKGIQRQDRLRFGGAYSG